ncbi:hypothetical protein BDY24DRAFT_371380 [Mrakia frigida]|uniref:uncharacterized protein n=1 Tax=Mrakia frigida TaxID=29902 RepID=UPI003FCBF2B1
MSTRSSRSSAPKAPPLPVPLYCICRQPDEPNRSMIACDGPCNEWFHWDCIDLDETAYEDILEYICPNCELTTGKSTTRQNLFQSPPDPSSGSPLPIDSPDADDEEVTSPKESKTSPKKKRAAPKKKAKAESKDEQEHVEEEEEEPKPSSSTAPHKRRSSSISTATATKPTKTSASSSSSKPHARRTSSHSTSNHQPFVPIPSDPKDDPTRKACLEGVLSVLLPLLGDAGKGKVYAQKLEELVWTAEEGGSTSGRKKYQDRMRSLRFNVSKSDRTELRSGISSGTISPERLSKMNSNDLANPTSQAAYTAATEASLRLRTIPTSSKATPLILHNHKGVVEVSDSREEMEREEENQRRQEEVERIKRKREREYEGSVQGVLEQAAAGAGKRRRSDEGGSDEEGGSGKGGVGESILPFVDTTLSSSNSNSNHLHENEKHLDPSSDFAMEFNEFLTDDVLGADEDDDDPNPNSLKFNHDDDDDDANMDLLGGGPGGGSPFRGEEDLEGEVDEAMFDFFVDEPREEEGKVEEVEVAEKVDKGKGKEVISTVVVSEEEKARKVEEELAKREVVWKGEIINPEIPLPGRLHARQIGGPVVPLETWSTTLFPKPSYTIIGRVPIETSRKFLLQMHLTPTKELVVVSLEGEGEEGGKSEKGLREFLVKRGRDALVQPYNKASLPVGGARDMYIVVLPTSDPLPEFLEIMDSNRLPAIRTKDYLLGVFIRARSYPASRLTGVIPSIATPPHNQQPPPPATTYHPPPSAANYPLPPSALHLQHPPPPAPPSSNSPYHPPQPHQQQQYRPPAPQHQQQGSYNYDASNSYPAPPPAGPDWYTPPSLSAPPPQNGYGGGYTPQQQQQQYGRPGEFEDGSGSGRGGGNGRGRGRGGGGRGGASWDAGRGSDQGWGRRGGRGG